MTALKAMMAISRYADGHQVLSKKLPGSDDKPINAPRRSDQALAFEQAKPCDAWIGLSNAVARAILKRGHAQ